jgi:predicted transposase/invertase (TIGR01784 family)
MNTLKKAEDRGRAKGREEGKAEIVKTMFKEKLTVDYIVKITGLTIEEIDKLIICVLSYVRS